jgi:hypothetical protein
VFAELVHDGFLACHGQCECLNCGTLNDLANMPCTQCKAKVTNFVTMYTKSKPTFIF